jgi:hypothetical protein
MDQDEAFKIAQEQTGLLVDRDMRKGDFRGKDAYDGFYNGFYSGLMHAGQIPIEKHAFGSMPKAHIRIIVGLGGQLDLTEDVTAHALEISGECKGETNREGLTQMLGSALAAITAYAQNLTPAFEDKKRFGDELSAASVSYLGAMQARMTPDIRLVERDRNVKKGKKGKKGS